MQGDKTEKQSTQNTFQSQVQNLLGNSSARVTPYAPTQDQIAQLLSGVSGVSAQPTGAETGALDKLVAMGQAGSPYAAPIGNLANTLLSGNGLPDRTGIVNDAYNNVVSALTPTARGDYLSPASNPFFNDVTNTIGNDVTNRIKATYLAAGRDPSGVGGAEFARELGRGVGEATAPVFSNVYTTERGNQLGAINNLFGAGNTAAGNLSSLDQARLGSLLSGVGVADAATSASMFGPSTVLAAEAQRRGIPLQTLAQQMGIVLPVAQTFGEQTGNTSQYGTTTGTGTATGTETTTTKKDPLSQILGAAIGGAGLIGGLGGFGNNGWLYSTGSSGGGLLNGMGGNLFKGYSNGFYPGVR